jgi:hypothetical protein
MLRRLAPLLLAPLIASCQPPELTVRAAFIGKHLVFVAVDGGDSDSTGCWREGVVVDEGVRPVWRFTGPGAGECRKLFPLLYGRAPAGTRTAIEASSLGHGRLYLFIGDSTGAVSRAFAFSRAGSARIVHNVDPDSPAAASLRERWWKRTAPGIDDSPPPRAEARR